MSQCHPHQSPYMSDPNMYAVASMMNAATPGDMPGACNMMGPGMTTAGVADLSQLPAAAAAVTDMIDSYGPDDLDDNNDDNNNDPNDPNGGEQLACTVCRGRRMCFCYFLKVRYYKFPSFLDLVDHQYKKWRMHVAKNGRQQS